MDNNNSTEHPHQQPTRSRNRVIRRLLLILAGAFLLGALTFGVLFWMNRDAGKDASDTEKILTIADLETSEVQLTSEVSDASVKNLDKELKAKIDKQVASKENPIETVWDLVDVLCSTVNTTRPTQCVDYVKEFLDTKMDTLKLTSDTYGQPDDLQLNYWRAQFYSILVSNYGFMMDNEFTDSDGKPMDTTSEQLKYVDLYLEIAQNPASWGEPQVNEEGRTWYFYEYERTSDMLELREQLNTGGTE